MILPRQSVAPATMVKNWMKGKEIPCENFGDLRIVNLPEEVGTNASCRSVKLIDESQV